MLMADEVTSPRTSLNPGAYGLCLQAVAVTLDVDKSHQMYYSKCICQLPSSGDPDSESLWLSCQLNPPPSLDGSSDHTMRVSGKQPPMEGLDQPEQGNQHTLKY